MPQDLIAQLEEWKSGFGTRDVRKLHRLLRAIARHAFTDADSLVRLHECLLFLRGYPASAQVMRLADAALSSFASRMAAARDPETFEDPAVSGISGTSFSAVFSYEVARELAARYPRDIEVDWPNYQPTDALGRVLRRLVPLAADDWPVEAHVPFRAWVDAARPPRSTALGWMLAGIASLPLGPRDQADLYDSLDLLLLWRILPRASRSGMRLPAQTPYIHRQPLLRRSDISLARELAAPPLPVKQLAPPQARRALDLILDTSAMRYRELYGFSHPDTARVFRADAGRGLEIVFFGVPPEWRLPLRAYHAGMFFSNGVPAGYVEVLSLCERAEVGFNLYYTFRDGESAWIYARLLRLFHQILGVRSFSVDPYQVGCENDEALDSGAFWFYRKLGFRSLDASAIALVRREEDRIRRTPGYRSSRPILRQLARSYMLYELGGGDGAWDGFRMRTLSLRGARAGSAPALLRRLSAAWSPADRSAVEAILNAKHAPDEARYLRLMQRHARLRAALIKLGTD